MGETTILGDRISRDAFWRLPAPLRRDGAERRTGVEIEFAGLTEREAARVVKALWGGKVKPRSSHVIDVEHSEIGTVRIELDTAWKDKAESQFAEALLELSREVVPVEVVTEPLPTEALPKIERLIEALARAGALGTEDGLFLAFGLHLNTEVASEDAAFIVPVVRAFAFLEDWLRASDPPDLSRRVLPFIDPWPRSFVDRCAEDGAGWGLEDLCGSYLELIASRNHGLDLMPLLEHLFPERVVSVLPEGQAKGGRPTWHYRLPESGLGVEGWSVAYEWNRWVLVERVATDLPLLEALAKAWSQHRSSIPPLRSDWASDVAGLLQDADLWDGRGLA